MEAFYVYKLTKITSGVDYYQLHTFRAQGLILAIYFNIVSLPQLIEVIEIHFANPEEHNVNINFHSEH